jgi:penicillin-binding protein 1A
MPLAGKTGTTNDANDTWFVGFSPDLVAGVYVGFDQPRTLGPHEQGASVAAPIFAAFMGEALKGKPPTDFRIPPGVRLVRVDAATGRLAEPGDRNVIWEAFKPDSEPSEEVIEGGRGVSTVPTGVLVPPDQVPPLATTPSTGTGGLY